MKKSKIKDVVILELKKNQIISEEIEKIIKKNKIKCAYFNGSGEGYELEIKYIISKDPIEYKNIKCEGIYEISSFVGTIKNGKYISHVLLTNNIANAIGGKFVDAKVYSEFNLFINILEYNK